jgi:hypothetical protein
MEPDVQLLLGNCQFRISDNTSHCKLDWLSKDLPVSMVYVLTKRVLLGNPNLPNLPSFVITDWARIGRG